MPGVDDYFNTLFGGKKPGANGFQNQQNQGPTPEPNGSGNGPSAPRTDKKKWMKFIPLIVVVVIVAVLATDCFYTIGEQEQAVVTTFGKASAVTDAGLHFKIPFLQQVHKVNTTIQGFALGYDLSSGQSVDDESLMITSDYNFVDVDFYVEFMYSDPVKAVYASSDPVEILKNITQGSIRNVIGSYDVDSVLTTGKAEIQTKIRDSIIAQLEMNDIGVALINISMQDAEPPTAEVMEAFKSVETAKQGADTSVNNANKYQNEKLPAAEARVDQILQEAEAEKQQRINEANAEVSMFNAQFDEYVKNPEITRSRMFYEAMEDILPELKVIINGTDADLSTFFSIGDWASAPASNIAAGSGE